MDTQVALERWRHEACRERTRLEQQAKDQQRRDAMAFVLERGIRDATASAPDIFPATDPRRLALLLVDEILGAAL
jgi:hypothetical protein